MNAVTKDQNSPPTKSEIIARMLEIRKERKRLAELDKELVAEWEALQGQILALLKEQGEVSVSSKQATASIGEQILPFVEDWDAYWEYMKENDAPHLLQRRPATNAFRELLEQAAREAGIEDVCAAIKEGKALPTVIPGTRAIVKETINLRAKTE